MGVLRVLIFLILPFPVVQAKKNCHTSLCRSTALPLRFPFRLTNQPQDCGYAGFNLSCGIGGVTILNLPYSGSFFVRDIDYKNQNIKLYDPYRCIQSRLFYLNLSSTPFQAVQYRNYTFFICSAKERSSYDYIDCLSNSTHHIIATSSAFEVILLSSSCKIIDTRPIAVPSEYESINRYYLLLKWDVPNCKFCEAKGQLCGFKNSKTQEINCIRDSAAVKGMIRVIIIAISLFITVFTVSWICYKCMKLNSLEDSADNASMMIDLSRERASYVASSGFDGFDNSRAESYETVILGESRRVLGPNSPMCPICLEDYLPKDLLKHIPECEHCFHADCIDEWLRLKSICPVCRNSPCV